MKIMAILSLVFVGITTLCRPDLNNPLDELSGNFNPPQIIVNSDSSSIINEETIHCDSGMIVIEGNHSICRYRLMLDEDEWSEWEPAGEYAFKNLPDGNHSLYIESKYDKGDRIFRDTIDFVVKVAGYRPSFSVYNDTVISLFPGMVIQLKGDAKGADTIEYKWIKQGDIEKVYSGKTLEIDSFTITDTGSYQCTATNEYGKVSSRVYRLKILSPRGIIRGTIADSKDSNSVKDAEITIISNGVKAESDKTGMFKFDSLSDGNYSIKISHPELKDTTIDDIKVGYTGVVDLKTIYLSEHVFCSIVYSGNENDSGSIPIDSSEYKSGDITATLDKNTLHRNGYTFYAWNTKENGKGDTLKTGDSITVTENVTLYAQWKVLPTYSVTYNRNGAGAGEVPIDDGKYYEGKKVIVKGNSGELQKEGLLFAGWCINQKCDGDIYNAGSQFEMPDSTVTLYVKWTEKPTYTITYNGNENNGGEPPATVTTYFGASVTIAAVGELIKTGYSVGSWNTNKDGSGNKFDLGQKIIMDSVNIDLYAQWEINHYTITFNSMGGSDVDKQEGLYNDILKTPDTPVRKGYVFDGWYTDTTFTTKFDFINQSITANDSLFAKWTLIPTHTVTYDGNGNTGGIVPEDNQIYVETAGATAKVMGGSGLVKNDSVFAYWNTNADGTGSFYAVGSSLQMGTSDVVLYAVWKNISTYTVTYNGNGNTGGTVPFDPNFYTPIDAIYVMGNTGKLEKTGFTFAGWNTKPDYSGNSLPPGAVYAVTSSDLTLYAKWKLNP